MALLTALLVGAVGAQDLIALRAVKPREGYPGEEMELFLTGRGFEAPAEMRVAIDDLEVLESWVESDESMVALVFIPEGARPGPRTVEVIGVWGENEEFPATLKEGFWVLEREEPPPDPEDPPPDPVEPPPDPEEPPPDEPGGDGGEWQPPDGDGDDFDGGGWLLVILAGAAGLVLLGALMLQVQRVSRRKQWQNEAQEGELTESCQTGSWAVRREKIEIKPGRWKVAGLKVTVYDSSSGRGGEAHEASPELVKQLDQAARQRLLRGGSEVLDERVSTAARKLADEVAEWQVRSRVGSDIYLKAQLEGGEASAEFARYRCVGKPGRWKKVSEWTAKLKAVEHLPAGFYGPTAGEATAAYRTRLEGELSGYLGRLIEEAGRLF
jgi:hypothetical protein